MLDSYPMEKTYNKILCDYYSLHLFAGLFSLWGVQEGETDFGGPFGILWQGSWKIFTGVGRATLPLLLGFFFFFCIFPFFSTPHPASSLFFSFSHRSISFFQPVSHWALTLVPLSQNSTSSQRKILLRAFPLTSPWGEQEEEEARASVLDSNKLHAQPQPWT